MVARMKAARPRDQVAHGKAYSLIRGKIRKNPEKHAEKR